MYGLTFLVMTAESRQGRSNGLTSQKIKSINNQNTVFLQEKGKKQFIHRE